MLLLQACLYLHWPLDWLQPAAELKPLQWFPSAFWFFPLAGPGPLPRLPFFCPCLGPGCERVSSVADCVSVLGIFHPSGVADYGYRPVWHISRFMPLLQILLAITSSILA